MDENLELVEHIYKDAEMSTFTLTKLLEELKEKDNKIKGTVEDILKGYERYQKESKEILETAGVTKETTPFFAKMGADMGIRKEVKKDNSDSSMASTLIEGISMGKIDMEKKLRDYESHATKEHLAFAKKFLTFQEDILKELEKYL